MRYSAIVIAAAAFAGSDGVSAQSNIVAPSGVRSATAVVRSVSESDLKALVLAEAYTVDEMRPFEAPSVRGKTKEGHKFVLIGTACDKSGVAGCQGVMMQVRYDADEAVTTDKINAANLKEGAVSNWWDQSSKTFGFTRYVVLDDGVTWMNLRQNLRVLLSVEAAAVKTIWPD